MTDMRYYDDYANDMNRIAFWLVNNNKQFNTRAVYGYGDSTADYCTIINTIKERGKNFQADGLITEFVECAIVDNTDYSFLPNYVDGADGTRIYKDTYVDMAKRCSLWEVEHNGSSPKFIWFEKEASSTGGEVVKAIYNATGVKITDYKTLFNAFKKAVYGYYYNDVYTQKQSLSRLKSKLPINCADLNQLAHAALKELNYEVQIVRGTIKCPTVYGHVWCRVKIDGFWLNFDASAAAKGKNLGSMICGSIQEITNINPAWAVSDDGIT